MGAWRRDFVAGALATGPSCLWSNTAFLAVHIKVKGEAEAESSELC
jgi:hypothetical protein